VIDNPKYAFRFVPRQGVIQSRSQVQHHHGSREHARTDNCGDATTLSGGQEETWSRYESREETDAVTHAIRDFLSDGRHASRS